MGSYQVLESPNMYLNLTQAFVINFKKEKNSNHVAKGKERAEIKESKEFKNTQAKKKLYKYA